MTLRRIPSEQLRVGMYIHAFDGSWFDHPFWSRNFLLQRESDLATVLRSDISTLLIDTSKGADLPLPAQTWAESPAEDTRTPNEKTAAATQVVNRARDVVRGVFDSARLGKAIESRAVTSVVEEVVTSIENNRHALLKVLRLKKKDEYTYLHSVAVCALMVNLARQLGIDEQSAADLGTAGLLHDIGKVMVPAEVLNKPGKLTEEEYVLAKTHALEGYRLLGEVDDLPATALDVCQHHHEKIDGTGYPHGLRGAQVSRAARMGAICDVYDAVTSNRPYKDAWTPLDAITRMRQWAGHFDPQILSAFMVSIGVFPLGTVVQLCDDRLGVVIEGGRNSTRPKVLAFYSIPQRKFTRNELVVAGDGRSGSAIVAEVDPAAWGITREKIDRLVRLGVPWV
jgi:putative nucleotidyltransferase with HDIG domain